MRYLSTASCGPFKLLWPMKIEHPKKKYDIEFEWKGELCMSGPEHGIIRIGPDLEISGVQPSVAFSEDGELMAFPAIKFPPNPRDLPSSGIGITIVNLNTKVIRHISGNKGFAEYKLNKIENNHLHCQCNGNAEVFDIGKINWA